MAIPTKIATCCYCGAKTALALEKGRHELSCASCGAPLRDLKKIPVAPKPARKAVSHQTEKQRFFENGPAKVYKKRKPRKVKKRRSWLKDIAEELFDIVEDVFD